VVNLAQEREAKKVAHVERIFHTIHGLQEDEACIYMGLQKDESHIGYTWFVVEKTTYVHGFPVGESCI
jgi:hypothetical protein